MQNEITQRINQLNYAINSQDTGYLQHTIDDIERKNIWLRNTLVAESIVASSRTTSPITVPSQYEINVWVANKYINMLQFELIFWRTAISSNAPFSYRAIYGLYCVQNNIMPNSTVVDKSGKRITIADVLSAISYAKSIAETIGVRIDDKYSVALGVLKSIELVLNNKKSDKPANKALHLTNDVLTEIAKKAVEDKKSSQIISGISLLFDITIDFVVKE